MSIIRILFYALLVRPLLILLLGLNVRHLERLTVSDTACMIAANHNSHLDTLVLMSLFKLKDIPNVKFVAARDYWCRNAVMTWFSLNIIGIIPIERHARQGDPLAPIIHALDNGITVAIFPEGSRGAPEQRAPLKLGIAKIIQSRPHTTITPVYMHGLGKSLPRGTALFVPFVCDINIGEPIMWPKHRIALISALDAAFTELEQEIKPKEWL